MIVTNAFQLLALILVAAIAYRTIRDMLPGRTGKTLAFTRIVIFAVMLAVFVYGLIFFIDAPIHPCGKSFCGKTGTLHTAGDYRHFMVWQSTLIVTWIIGIPIQIGLWMATRWDARER